jgi:TonB family protein
MNIKPYCISIFLHIMLVLFFVLKWQASTETVVLGDSAKQVMSSYVYKGETSHHNNKRADIVKKENTLAINTKKSSSSQSDNSGSASQGVKTDELLATLHAAIQKQQHYPLSAMQMERQGRATMMFTLFPDGRIQSLRVLKSSGTESLDAAALAAVQDAVPFHQVDKYLKFAKEFRIDVVFELA